MAWIESHQSLATHGKLIRLARELGITKYQAIGHLQSLWWWAIDNATDGSLEGQTPQVIAEAAGWTDHQNWWRSLQCNSPTGSEDIGSDGFFAALVNCRWIDSPNNGEQISPLEGNKSPDDLLPPGTCIHNWLDYCGDLVKKRLEREQEKHTKSDNIHAQIDMGNKSPHTKGNKSPPTVPYRTVPNSTNTKNTTPTPSKGNEEFILPDWIKKETWDAFMEVRKKKKAVNTPQALKSIITELVKLKATGNDPEKVLERSIRSSWKDVYELAQNGGNGSGKHQGYNHQEQGNDSQPSAVTARTRGYSAAELQASLDGSNS